MLVYFLVAANRNQNDRYFRLELMLSDPAPYIRSMVPSPEEEAGSLLNIDLDEALDRYVRERARLVKRLKELSVEDWQRTAEHEEYSHYSIVIMFRELLLHEMLHAYRIVVRQCNVHQPQVNRGMRRFNDSRLKRKGL